MSKQTKTSRSVKARALVDLAVDGKNYRAGELLVADAEVIKNLGSQVDTHPDAVAYCEEMING